MANRNVCFETSCGDFTIELFEARAPRTTGNFIELVSEWWPRMEFIEPLSLFNYVGGREIGYGWPVSNMCVLATVLVIAAISGSIIWQRRDLPL